MNIKDFQKISAEIVEEIDKKHNIKRGVHFNFVQLMEEVGELARAINLPKLRSKKPD